jgi:DNA-binding CsgD family transcriptional regulator
MVGAARPVDQWPDPAERFELSVSPLSVAKTPLNQRPAPRAAHALAERRLESASTEIGRDVTQESRREAIALTPRQWEVLRLLLLGVRVPAIAAKLGVTRSTVRNHLATIFRRCGVHTQSELIEFFHERAPIRVDYDGHSEIVGER